MTVPVWLALAAWPALGGVAREAADLGPAVIDVSSYPEEHRRAYAEVFLPLMEPLGGAARVVNSPLLELDPAAEAAARRADPELFADPEVLRASPRAWRDWVEQARSRPACCGSCLALRTEDWRALWRFLAYDSVVRKTGPNAAAWVRRRRALLERFRAEEASP